MICRRQPCAGLDVDFDTESSQVFHVDATANMQRGREVRWCSLNVRERLGHQSIKGLEGGAKSLSDSECAARARNEWPSTSRLELKLKVILSHRQVIWDYLGNTFRSLIAYLCLFTGTLCSIKKAMLQEDFKNPIWFWQYLPLHDEYFQQYYAMLKCRICLQILLLPLPESRYTPAAHSHLMFTVPWLWSWSIISILAIVPGKVEIANCRETI